MATLRTGKGGQPHPLLSQAAGGDGHMDTWHRSGSWPAGKGFLKSHLLTWPLPSCPSAPTPSSSPPPPPHWAWFPPLTREWELVSLRAFLPQPRSMTQGQWGSGKCSLQRRGIRGQALPNTVRAWPRPHVQTGSSSQAASAPAGLILWGHCPGELFSAGSPEAVGPAPGQGGPGLAPHSLCASPLLRRHPHLWAWELQPWRWPGCGWVVRAKGWTNTNQVR